MAFLSVVSEGELQERDRQESEQRRQQIELETQAQSTKIDNLAAHIRKLWMRFDSYRSSENIDQRIIDGLRTYNGEYSPAKLVEINRFGGSDVFARITTVKCRGATAMLRDIFLGQEQPWGISPTPDPEIGTDLLAAIDQKMAQEMMEMWQLGMAPPPPENIAQRRNDLIDQAQNAELKYAKSTAGRAETAMQDILVEGGFYDALREFLIDLPIYPYAVLKGPIIQLSDQVKWNANRQMEVQSIPKMFWRRVDPLDVWFTPGGTTVETCTFMEKLRLTRGELASLIGVPGYDEEAIRNVLREYRDGLTDWSTGNDTEYAELKSQESPNENDSELIDSLEFHGNVPGQVLLDHGFDAAEVPDADVDYHITAWQVGQYVIKAQLTPSPRKRPPYYVSAYEKVPGSLIGHGLPEIIGDIQAVANATLRSLVNNMSIASGPQVSINEDLLSPTTNGDDLYPWKRWRFTQDPLGSSLPPISFFQPNSNSQELMTVYANMAVQADEISAIPRYITGSNNVGGAASTASGLSMLMNNATKVLQNIASQIDADIMRPLLQQLYDMLMLTDDRGVLRGDENIVVRGVSVAMKRETDRMRQIEFLSLTSNPVDLQIIGTGGRATLLRSIATGLGLDGEEIVPSETELEKRDAMAKMQMQAQMQSAASAPIGPENPNQGQPRIAAPMDNAQRVRTPQAVQRQAMPGIPGKPV